ncbi:MAG TPA: SOS response-associated peptidase [Beutenbergiaceae bacterium]|nr:SOS response-associated peptidase [Beutenbergiaceae bacterium]
MCGRYASFRSAQDLADAFDVEEITAAAAQVAAAYNVAPTDGIRMVVDRPPKPSANPAAKPDPQTGAPPPVRGMHLARWGLVPAWAKDLSIGARMINARSETVDTKSAFAKPLRTKRCIVLADGYYEWHTAERPGGGKPVKTPYYVHPTDGSPIAFAGLYSWWRDPAKGDTDEDRWVLSATIITQPARDGLEQIHEREPAVLDHDLITSWLDPDRTGAAEALGVLAQPSPPLSWHEVGSAVGSVRNDGPELIEPV